MGRLGNGSISDSYTQVGVSGFSNATNLGVGADHGCAPNDDETIRCWGRNDNGQLGTNTVVTWTVAQRVQSFACP